MLTIYLVQRTDDYGYDETVSYVAFAADEAGARKLGEPLCGDQAPSIWYAPTTLVVRLGSGPAPEPFIAHEHNR